LEEAKNQIIPQLKQVQVLSLMILEQTRLKTT